MKASHHSHNFLPAPGYKISLHHPNIIGMCNVLRNFNRIFSASNQQKQEYLASAKKYIFSTQLKRNWGSKGSRVGPSTSFYNEKTCLALTVFFYSITLFLVCSLRENLKPQPCRMILIMMMTLLSCQLHLAVENPHC